MTDVLTSDAVYELAIAISASEGLGGASWQKIRKHDEALRASLAAAEARCAAAEERARKAEAGRLAGDRILGALVKARDAAESERDSARAKLATAVEALRDLLPCADLWACGCDAFVEHEHFGGACGPVVHTMATGRPCNCEACRARKVLKEVTE